MVKEDLIQGIYFKYINYQFENAYTVNNVIK